MQIRSLYFVIILHIYSVTALLSQTIVSPNYGIKSHETLEISKVEITSDKTVMFMAIENHIAGGNFCADRNIYLIDPDGGKLKLIKSTGIPECPDTYKFKSIGEKLQFTLEFPPLKAATKWIDIVEECNENCFSFYGVVLNNELNAKINEALSLAEKGESTKSIALYKNILNDLPGTDDGIKGALYTEIITLSFERGDKSGAKEWYDKMVASKAPRLEFYIRNLSSRGIRY